MEFAKFALVCLFGIAVCTGLPAGKKREVPPKIGFFGTFEKDYDREEIFNQVKSWSPESNQNIWELSGLWEGDIMPNPKKNGLQDETMRWPAGIVPVYIQEEDFDEEDIAKIKAAMEEYHEKTCLKFRSYNKSDEDYIVIQGSEAGCWSSVGRQGKGQLINLQNPGCVKHGTIVHEILHALGFYHQQSASDRDDYVKIVWENIKPGKESNFKKYDTNKITDYGVGYDYGSVMHYSKKAFSVNGEETIVPLKEGVEIGQRDGLSKKDITKLQAMYKDECSARDENKSSTHKYKPLKNAKISKSRATRSLEDDDNQEEIYNRINAWNEDSEDNLWELSGQLEGDILVTRKSLAISQDVKGLIDKSTRWPNGIIPYRIKANQFNDSDIAVIEKAIQEYHQRTCLIFRPYNKTEDQDHLAFQSSKAGCWSTVGRQGGRQAINLQRPKCMKHGLIVHELMHTVGFHHEHSHFNRDEYIRIEWDNIKEGREKNFKKYDEETVTDFGVGYDYKSIMHYSRKVFSANGKPTIIPLQEGVKIGQREKLSEKDVLKVQLMYKEECSNRNKKSLLD